MSPSTLRRYRAERLLREEFERLRGRVLAKVRGRLRASGVRLDAADLDACYAQAWQGLYTALLAGQEIDNPAGWLVLVTFRRAIEEHRARQRAPSECGPAATSAVAARAEQECARERDLAAELDDRIRLRQLFEGLRGRLSAREREAAVLCYLQGLPRAEAAERMGVSAARMRKLMEGRRAGQPGVAGKVGALVDTIRGGGWCEEQGSLMRGLAYGILDPQGERYRLAVMHRSECPACRAYVVSLRGLAATLPPVFLPAGMGAVALAMAGGGSRAAFGAAAGGGAGGGSSAGGATQFGAGIGSISGGGAAGAGGAGGGWLLAGGPVGAKLAVGCALALGVGAGCVALGSGLGRSHPSRHRRSALATNERWPGPGMPPPVDYLAITRGVGAASSPAERAAADRARNVAAIQPSGAGREFGPEVAMPTAGAVAARIVSARSPSATLAHVSPARRVVAPAGAPPSQPSPGPPSAADREFAPG
jgi:RNA polymerase sigma factor (sigma-70 family)